MLTLALCVSKLHPAVVSALCEAAGPAHKLVETSDFIDAIMAKCNEVIDEGRKVSETAYKATEKEAKQAKGWKVNLSGSVKGIKLPDSPVGLIVRLNTYLEGSREYFLRVETVKLPSSVNDFARDLYATMKEAAEKAAKVPAGK